MLIIILVIWDEEDNIYTDSGITCVIYTYMLRKKLSKKKDGTSEYEVASEPAPYLYSDERGYAEVVEADVEDFIDEYTND